MKWKNYGLWVSIASILYMVFRDLGVQIDLTSWETYVTAILGVLATLGIISNPEKGKGYFDRIPSSPVEAVTQVVEQLQNQQPQQTNTQPSILNLNQPLQSQQVTNQSQAIPTQNVAPQTQEVELSNVPAKGKEVPETAVQSNQQATVEPSTTPDQIVNENQTNASQTPTSRGSIHGMPAPPNEFM
ncbi:hypothetical protein ACLM5H_18435 [Fredinandcohnia humi]